MADSEMTQIDLECGGSGGCDNRRRCDSDEEESVCFSDADEGSCYSQFYSTYDGGSSVAYVSDHDEIGEEEQGSDSRRVSLSDCSVVDIIENGDNKVAVVHLGEETRDCRICHLSLVDDVHEFGVAIQLGCSCKDDLAAAHKQCAETWFKIKGNKTCEICNSIASNLVNPNEVSYTQQITETNAVAATAASGQASAVQNRSCINGHRLLNFLLACMVFAFVISWLFHFNIQS